jgi:hypothetical protein
MRYGPWSNRPYRRRYAQLVGPVEGSIKCSILPTVGILPTNASHWLANAGLARTAARHYLKWQPLGTALPRNLPRVGGALDIFSAQPRARHARGLSLASAHCTSAGGRDREAPRFGAGKHPLRIHARDALEGQLGQHVARGHAGRIAARVASQ